MKQNVGDKILVRGKRQEPEENMWILTLESQLGINSKEYYAKL